MKILFVTNYPSPYRVEFFNELGKYCDVTVIFEEDIYSQRERNVNWFNCNYSKFKAIFLKQCKFGNKFICFDVKDYVCDKSFDLVIITNYSTLTEMYAIYCMNRRKIKFAIEIDGGMPKSGKGIIEKLKTKLISSAQWWFSTSKLSDDYLITYGADKKNIFRYPFTSLNKSDVITEVISEDKKSELKKSLNIKEKKVIISVGQFIHRKGFDILLKSMKGIPREYGVYIVGGEPTEEYLKLKEELNLTNVHFEGFKTKEELKKYYMCADIFVLPTREDIWGLVINEAMANGLPIITTDKCVAGVELIKNNENGFIIPVEDEKELSDKIKVICIDEHLRHTMMVNNLKKINEFTVERMVEVHLEIFEEIMKSK